MGDENLSQTAEGKEPKQTPMRSYFFFVTVVLITIFTIPHDIRMNTAVTLQHVWYYGWITAIATGLGAVPFVFISEPNKFWMGVSNAIAGGMMIAASYSLLYEGSTYYEHNADMIHKCENHSESHHKHGPAIMNYLFDESMSFCHKSSLFKTIVGAVVGLLFIILTKKILDGLEHLKLGVIEGVSAQRMILILFVMTLHSLTEGIGIGVSFGGKRGMQLGSFISISLAMHNVPEGLAVALAATSRRIPPLQAGLWAITTSLPQPITAIPAFIFVDRSIHLLPLGLGFAAGAMGFVAVFELLAEAIEDAGLPITGLAGCMACGAMIMAQEGVKSMV